MYEKLKKIRTEGGSRVVTIGDIVPENWKYVKIEIIALVRKSPEMTVKITKMG